MNKSLSLTLLAFLASSSFAQSFRKLDNPLPNWPSYYASSISHDGRFVSGWAAGGPGSLASRWDLEAHSYLASPIPGDFTSAVDLSGDGSVAVGDTGLLPGVNSRAVMWDPAGATLIPFLQGGSASRATSVTSDGSTVLGVCAILVDPVWGIFEQRRFLYDTPSGTLTDFGVGGSPTSKLSGDGSTVVENESYWTQSTGWTQLPGFQTFAYDASETGRFIVGKSKFAGGLFRGMVFDRVTGQAIDAGSLGGDVSILGISADGTVAVGESNYLTGPRRAVWWRPGVGLRDLNDDFASIVPTGWHLEWGTAITPDGRYISGTAMDEFGASRNFVIDTVPEPGTFLALGAGVAMCLRRKRRVG